MRFGDIVLARKDMPAAYHLAVVVDDAFQGVTLVTRGEDLWPPPMSSGCCRPCWGCRSRPMPIIRLILDADGRKFSKRDQAVTLAVAAREGVTPADIRGRPWALNPGPMLRTRPCPTPLDRLFATIAARKGADPKSYTAKLLAEGVEKCAKKFGEEAIETVIAAVPATRRSWPRNPPTRCIIWLVLWAATGITPEDVYAELERAKVSRDWKKKPRVKA